MLRSSAWLLAGAVLATAGVAHAQEAAPVSAELTESRAAVPWYQRFTTSNGLTGTITGIPENDRSFAPAWTLNQRWGVTVDVSDAARIETGPDGAVVRGGEAAVGAYYQFTPTARVGAEVRVADPSERLAAENGAQEPNAGVRIESAFRF